MRGTQMCLFTSLYYITLQNQIGFSNLKLALERICVAGAATISSSHHRLLSQPDIAKRRARALECATESHK